MVLADHRQWSRETCRLRGISCRWSQRIYERLRCGAVSERKKSNRAPGATRGMAAPPLA